MSEKLYRLYKIIETFGEKGTISRKTLVFIDSDNHQYKVDFLANRTTVVFNGKVYDWYGREAKLEPDVIKVLSYFGVIHGKYQNHELFVVQLKNDRLAIARLLHLDNYGLTEYSYSLADPQYNETKSFIKGHVLRGKPALICHEWSFAKFFEPLTSPNCLDEINKCLQDNFGYTCKICVDAASKSEYNALNGTMFIKTCANNRPDYIENYVAYNRSSILASNSSEEIDLHGYSSSIYNLQFSKDGSKMTALIKYFSMHHGCQIEKRISTDIEIIRHTHTKNFLESIERSHKYGGFGDSKIYWYHDTEES